MRSLLDLLDGVTRSVRLRKQLAPAQVGAYGRPAARPQREQQGGCAQPLGCVPPFVAPFMKRTPFIAQRPQLTCVPHTAAGGACACGAGCAGRRGQHGHPRRCGVPPICFLVVGTNYGAVNAASHAQCSWFDALCGPKLLCKAGIVSACSPLTSLRLLFPLCRTAGGGRPQKGRDLHGTAIVPKLVAFLVLPAEVRLW